MTPYDVYENIYGPYDPEHPKPEPFSCWLGKEQADYLAAHPDAKRKMIDGHFFYESELSAFHAWVCERARESLVCR